MLHIAHQYPVTIDHSYPTRRINRRSSTCCHNIWRTKDICGTGRRWRRCRCDDLQESYTTGRNSPTGLYNGWWHWYFGFTHLTCTPWIWHIPLEKFKHCFHQNSQWIARERNVLVPSIYSYYVRLWQDFLSVWIGQAKSFWDDTIIPEDPIQCAYIWWHKCFKDKIAEIWEQFVETL